MKWIKEIKWWWITHTCRHIWVANPLTNETICVKCGCIHKKKKGKY